MVEGKVVKVKVVKVKVVEVKVVEVMVTEVMLEVIFYTLAWRGGLANSAACRLDDLTAASAANECGACMALQRGGLSLFWGCGYT